MLGIKRPDYIKIRDNCGDSDEQTCTLVSAWIQSGEASWAKLVRALRHPLVKQYDIANQITAEHPSKKTYNIQL